MSYRLQKRDLYQSDIVYSLLEDTPEVLEFKSCLRGYKYKDRNLKITIKTSLFANNMIIRVRFCNIKIKRSIDLSKFNYNLIDQFITETVEDIATELNRYFILPKDKFIQENKNRLSTDFTFIALLIAYNSEQSTIFKFNNGKIATTVNVEFLDGKTTRILIKNPEINTKCYYNHAGSLQTRVLDIIHLFN